MKKCRCFILILACLTAVTFSSTLPAHARHQIVIPYSFVGYGWGTEIVISNTSNKAISPILSIVNGSAEACINLATLQPGEIFMQSFEAITGWIGTSPIPGIFQVYIDANALAETDSPFGAAVEIYNSSFGGFSSQQFMSQYADESLRICFFWPL